MQIIETALKHASQALEHLTQAGRPGHLNWLRTIRMRGSSIGLAVSMLILVTQTAVVYILLKRNLELCDS